VLRKLLSGSVISRFLVVLNHSYRALNGYGRGTISDRRGSAIWWQLTHRPLRRLRDFSLQVTSDLNGRSASVKVRRPSTLGPNLCLKDIDFGRSPSHISTIRVDRTGMRFPLARAPAQPLAWQVRQNVFVAGVTTLERRLGETIVRLVLEGLRFSGWETAGENNPLILFQRHRNRKCTATRGRGNVVGPEEKRQDDEDSPCHPKSRHIPPDPNCPWSTRRATGP